MSFGALRLALYAVSWVASVTATSYAKEHHDIRREPSEISEMGHHSKKLLLFWAVGTRDDAKELIQKNLRTARESAGDDCCEVFLAHYKGGPDDWPEEWYSANVVGHTEQTGFKFQLLQNAFKSGALNEKRYDFVWVLDEDIELSNVGENLKIAEDSGALISGPAMWQTNRGVDWQINAVQQQCRYRYTNFVEVIAPLIRTEALEPILSDCEGCIHTNSVWGLDGVWCNFVASRLPKLVTPQTSCSIMDAAFVNHLDRKTLGDKHDNSDFRSVAKLDSEDTKRHYPQYYVDGDQQRTLKCVKYKFLHK